MLLESGAEPDPRLCAVFSGAWALLFLGLAYALWRRKTYTRLVAPLALLALGLYQTILPGPCVPPAQPDETASVAGIVYVAGVIFAALALNVPSGRAYFERTVQRAGQDASPDDVKQTSS
jgi:hypothetical protein